MELADIIRDKSLSLSFEVFPPKSEMNFLHVKDAIEEIAKLHPSFMSVTYGAGGGSTKYTLDFAKRIQDTYDVPSLAHLTCVATDRVTLQERIGLFKEAGIKNIMALRGDLTPELKEKGLAGHDFEHAVDLIKEIKKESSDFCIGAACYPEVHPESKNSDEDIMYLKEKVDAGADFLTTQMFFDNDIFYRFLEKIRNNGIDVPVVAGIMPISNAVQIKRAVEMSDCSIPKTIIDLVNKFGNDDEAMMDAGIIYTLTQIIDLYANGINHVHVYSMNKPLIAKKIQDNLKRIIGK